ncbi:hypothetical protein OEB99_16840 [Actinotalea sp. M2MS4P-6]|uniref:hypothetical protein n=1 Tax=Actinotalea sp. M2MS4P-6 TaxID=2983762 RepID=UPI0021E35987|nr:hypothetical protein [Actinotalea sp. M2MS4P-6]MCV2395982.1 hypothetical protein [Actinotalea sp. M2MS4P-6]
MSELIPEISDERTADHGALPGLAAALATLRRAVDDVPDGDAGRDRLLDLYAQSGRAVALAVPEPPALPPVDPGTDAATLRGRLVGWLDGLTHGVTVALLADQESARVALVHLRYDARAEHVPFAG